MADETRGVTFDFAGARLTPWQAAQRLYKAGFTDAKLCAIGYAVMMAESGRYLKAWHHNVMRDEAGAVQLDGEGKMTVKSTDLGYIQRNVVHNPVKLIPFDPIDSQALVDELFELRPELADGQESANLAWDLFTARGWQPWFAHTNGSYKAGLPSACVAVGKYLAMALCNDPDIVEHNTA